MTPYYFLLDVTQLTISDLNLVYACTKDKALMIDVQAREITERDLEAALKLSHVEVSSLSSLVFFCGLNIG